MPFTLPSLPWSRNALEPHIGAETIDHHHGKHHQGYVDHLNELVAGKPEASKTLEQIVQGAVAASPLFNNAAQAWSHAFYWSSMKPGGGGKPTGKLLEAVNRDFGSTESLVRKFRDAANGQFGSGWAWLIEEDGKLSVATTSNADVPMRHDQRALLGCDVWEHAYYLDRKSARSKYVEAFMEHLVDWDFAAKNLSLSPPRDEDEAVDARDDRFGGMEAVTIARPQAPYRPPRTSGGR